MNIRRRLDNCWFLISWEHKGYLLWINLTLLCMLLATYFYVTEDNKLFLVLAIVNALLFFVVLNINVKKMNQDKEYGMVPGDLAEYKKKSKIHRWLRK